MLKCLKSLVVSVLLSLGLLSSSSYAFVDDRPVVHLTGKNTVLIDTEMTFNSVHTFVQAIAGARMMLPADQTLYVLIASGGGYYHVGIIERQVLAQIPNIAIICKYCGSAAGYIFVTAKVPRLVLKSSTVMFHHMYLDHVTAEHATNALEMGELQQNSDDFDKAIYTVLRMSKGDYSDKIKDTTIWEVKGEDIIKLHGADKLIKVSCDEWVKRLAPNTCSDSDSQQ